MIINGNSSVELEPIESDSIDSVVTDPPYGIDFMLKDWDKGLPSIEIWKNCYRVMKSGSFIFVMCIPKSSVQARMVLMLEEAGFVMDFTPIYWAYASGFPKSLNISKAVDKRLGVERDSTGKDKHFGRVDSKIYGFNVNGKKEWDVINEAKSKEAKVLEGSYAGYQPKPSIEVILVGMKPLSEKTYVDQAMKDKKGITWLDNVRIPTTKKDSRSFKPLHSKQSPHAGDQKGAWNTQRDDYDRPDWESDKKGRFPANLVVSDDVLNDGEVFEGRKRTATRGRGGFVYASGKGYSNTLENVGQKLGFPDSGSFSRYFDIDNWFHQNINLEDLPESVQKTFPFIITAKPSKTEKNEGLEGDPNKPAVFHFRPTLETNPENWKTPIQDMAFGGANRSGKQINNHPTVKPIKLMSYLITLGSKKGDIILDPFLGSGTTAIACVLTNRKYIGIELDENYFQIALQRLKYYQAKQEKKDRVEYYRNRI